MSHPESEQHDIDRVTSGVASTIGDLMAEFAAAARPGQSTDLEAQTSRDRRRETRRVVERPVVVTPVGKDGLPDASTQITARLHDVSPKGVGLILRSEAHVPSRELIVGVPSETGLSRFVGVQVRHEHGAVSRELMAGAEIGGVIQSILSSGHITPTCRPDTMEFTFEYPTPLLRALANLGVLKEKVIDHVQLCPKCQGLPTFRSGCRKCGSSRVSVERFIHHFACAHVAPVAEFDSPRGLVCPKCQNQALVVGADFEYLKGQYHCTDCGGADSQLEQIGHCLRCGFRFPGEKSTTREVVGFHAHRLDPLDLVPSP